MSTRDHIIDQAEALIRTRGYNGFSYGDISSVLNIRNAAIHYYFPSKTDLGISVVDRELEKIYRSRTEWITLPADQQLRKVVETFYGSSRKGWICLNGSLSPDYLTLPEPLQQKVAAMCREVLSWMTGCLEKGLEDGSLRFEGTAEDRALMAMSALVSSLVLSRVLGSEVFDRMLNQLLKDLKSIS